MTLAETETLNTTTDEDRETPPAPLPVVVYSPESPLANPSKLIREIFTDLWRSRELTWILFARDLRAQFRESVLGYFWLVAPALMTTGVWLFLNESSVVNIADTGMPYTIFVLIGTIFWQCFSAGVSKPLQAYNAGKPVFMKLKVAPEAFIAAGNARVLFDFLISFLLLAVVFAAFQTVPAWSVVLLPVPILGVYLLSTAIGVLLIPIGSLYRDVGQAAGFALRFAMFFAPVVYPRPNGGALATVMALNPVTPILESARDLSVTGTLGSLPAVGVCLVASAIVLFVGLIILRVAQPHLVARMGM